MFRFFFILFIINSWIFSNENEKLPQSYLKNLDGKKIDIIELNNTPMVINFWFLACSPCIKEMKYLNIFNKKYQKYGFKVVSVNTDNSRTLSRVKPYVNSQKYSFEILSDPKSLFFRKLGGQICPYLIIVDSEGNVVNKHIGYNPGDEINLEKEIVELLESSIRLDTNLTDTSIINILKAIEEDSTKEDVKVLPLIETHSE